MKDKLREAFKAGFMAHPEAEAPVFKWSFAAETCIAADREQSAWDAYCEQEHEKWRHAIASLIEGNQV